MKKRMNISIGLAFTLGALVLVGCAKEQQTESPTPNDTPVTVTITASTPTDSDTRVHLEDNLDGTFNPMWDNGDALGVYASNDGTAFGGTNISFTTSTANIDTDTGVATFTGTFTGELPTTGSFTYYAYSPRYSSAGSDPTQAILRISASQSPTATSYAKAADLLLGKPVTTTSPVGFLDAGSSVPLNFQFSRIGAIARFGVTNIPNEITSTDYVQKVILTFDTYVVDQVIADLTATTPTWEPEGLTSASKTITLTYSGNISLDDDFEIWWGMLPGATKLTNVTIETLYHSLSKDVNRDMNFQAAKLTTATLDFSADTTLSKWILVSDVANVTSGSKYIIVMNVNTMSSAATSKVNKWYYLINTPTSYTLDNIVENPQISSAMTVTDNQITTTQYNSALWSVTGDNTTGFVFESAQSPTNYLWSTTNSSVNDDYVKVWPSYTSGTNPSNLWKFENNNGSWGQGAGLIMKRASTADADIATNGPFTLTINSSSYTAPSTSNRWAIYQPEYTPTASYFEYKALYLFKFGTITATYD
jgi:hypothetical protein